jgi:tRNA1(Val) A37 N6-methylase TrmN6
MTDRLSRDAFLGGRLHLLQPQEGYRAGVDPVLLAASVPAVAGHSVLELGCGVGTALFCLGVRVPGLELTGLELQVNYADLARRNAAENQIDAEVITGNLACPPETLRARRFDHVIANPPYFDRRSSTSARDAGREAAMGEDTPLETWVKAASKRCAPKGYVSIIHRAARLPELLALMSSALGSVQVLPFIPRDGREAKLVIVRGRKSGSAAFSLHSGLIMHAGPQHRPGAENYSEAMTSVLREGAALDFPT